MGESGSRIGLPYFFIRPELTHCHSGQAACRGVSIGRQLAANSKHRAGSRR